MSGLNTMNQNEKSPHALLNTRYVG